MSKDTKELTINEFLTDPELMSDWCFNFYDWFCPDSSLKRRMMSMVPKVKFLVKMGVIDGDKLYVWFKNNCPVHGKLYDDMRFSVANDDNDYRGGIAPRQGYTKDNRCNVWFFTGEKKKELKYHYYETWQEFKNEIKNCKETREYFRRGFAGEL